MWALYQKNNQTGESDTLRALLSQARQDLPTLGAGGDECLFTQNGRAMCHRHRPSAEHSMFFPYSPGTFSIAALSEQLRLFPNAWSLALLEQLNTSLADNGMLLLPQTPEREAQRKRQCSAKWFQHIFGQPAWTSRGGDWAVFRKVQNFPAQPSVLAWLFKEYGLWLSDMLHLRSRGITPLLQRSCADFLVNPSNAPAPDDPASDAPRDGPVRLSAELDNHVGMMSYLMGGVSYKTELVRHIVTELSGRQTGLSMLDMGGGSGLVAAELLLTDSRFTRAGACDPTEHNLATCRRLFGHYRRQLTGRFFFALGAAESFDYDRCYDVVSFIGSLLYVPRQHTAKALDRAWAALAPGGLLVIHENIKNPAFSKDHDVMFTVDELEGYLAKYGEIRYYLSTAAMSIPRSQAAQKTVFRVVRKF